MRLYDAHNHLHDDRLRPWRTRLLEEAARAGVVRMVVNGCSEADWTDVAALARKHTQILPSFGYHPWYVHERTSRWQRRLVEALDSMPSSVGEIGLDRWILDPRNAASQPAVEGRVAPLDEQVEVFTWQLHLASERNRPVSIHCLQSWGRLYDILRAEPRPACGFLLHSYGGPAEMVKPLANLGAYFSFPGYFAHERKHRQREAFRRVPPDRLLLETDAPDQCLPDHLNRHPLTDGRDGRQLNHPANLGAICEFVAAMLEQTPAELAERVEENFRRLFNMGAPPRSPLDPRKAGA